MKFNKKYIISAVVLVVAVVLSATLTYSRKANADEETLTQVKMELQKQIDDKTKELEDKDKQLEDLNNKVSEQSATIDQLNNSIQNLNNGLNSTNVALDNAKKVQKQDKAEVTSHADTGDANLQKQVDTINEEKNKPRVFTQKSDGKTGEE